MIIRNYTTGKTAERSPLSSRSVRRTCGKRMKTDGTLKECPITAIGRPLWGRYLFARQLSGGAPHTPAIERRRSFPTCGRLPVAFQRLGDTVADNHKRLYN